MKQGGDRKSEKSKLQAATLILDDLGIEKTESHRLQKIAAIPAKAVISAGIQNRILLLWIK